MAQISGHMPRSLRTDAAAVAHEPGLQAFWALRIGFTVAPLVAGLDKFFDILPVGTTTWTKYLAPWAVNLLGTEGARWYMWGVGVVEIIAGIGVLLWPRIFGYVVSAWLLAITVNLLTFPPDAAYFDIALRDVGLAFGAFALAKLAAQYGGTRTYREPVART